MRNFIDIVESRASGAVFLYHVTPKHNMEGILRDGLKPTSYWAIKEVSDYYAEDIRDVVTFKVPLSRLLSPIPDMPGIEEPVVYQALGKKEDQVHAEWADSNKTWQDSLAIIGSIACTELIPVTKADIVKKAKPVKPKEVAPQPVVSTYRRLCRLEAEGTIRPRDVDTKKYIEKTYQPISTDMR